MQTVTTSEIEAAFKTAIRDIVPQYVPLQSCRWAYVDRIGRKGGKPELMGKATRSYNMVWGPGAPTYAWFGSGTAYAARLAIATSYAGVDPQLLQHMLTADGVDLRDALNVLRDGTEDVSVGGLCDMPYLGLQNEDADDLGNIYVEHVFTIHYHQATDA